jgi:lipid-A-disaccharide synthase
VTYFPHETLSDRKITFGIIAGEASGDILGAGLVRSLRQRYPRARFVGIGGEEMIAEGFHSLVPMERLSVMGLVEVLGRIRELFSIRARLLDYFFATPPDVVIGIDSPDFTLAIERRCREAGILSVHYVSPSVWAWRRKRIFKIARSVNLMLTLFPFEARFYEEHQVPVAFVGHPLADRIAMEPDTLKMRESLGIDAGASVLAVLPGSRAGEVDRLGALFLEASRWLQERRPDLQLVIPCVNRDREKQVRGLVDALDLKLPVTIVRGRSRDVMAAADVVLLASGTATLEAMLLKKPMVVGYRLSGFSYALLSKLVKVPHVALPNLLAGRQLVPELLQGKATAESLGGAVLERLEDTKERARLKEAFTELHHTLKQGADEKAAQAISDLLEQSAH